MPIFSRFLRIHAPSSVRRGPSGGNLPFEVEFMADGDIPFPQIVVRAAGRETIIGGTRIRMHDDQERRGAAEVRYVATVDGDLTRAGEISLQIEGCVRADIHAAHGDDWIKAFVTVRLEDEAQRHESSGISYVQSGGVKLYFGIHKHMHQPYYDTTDRRYWDGEKDGIFGSRAGNYTHYIPAAVRQYAEGGLPHAGLSTSWSGSLIEQLHRCAADGLAGGRFAGWNSELSTMAGLRTALGHPRVDFSAFGFFHPLMPLIPSRDIVKQIEWHRRAIREAFGAEASRILFPPETAFHVRMIPALIDAGIEAVIYDSIHRFRACKGYPYAGLSEGMLPPNPAEQVNPPVDDWLQLENIWAGSKISPSLLRPEYVEYVDAEGRAFRIVAVPAERYIGNEDARGGFGALLYPEVLGQVYDRIVASGGFDPAHPPFFILHSDGDNHGGGADSYYKHNTGSLVEWLRRDPRFELTSIRDYLGRFPPDPARVTHIEPGAWSGADNGDPQFMKWFSRSSDPYSPDLNSWAVLTALQNIVHTLEDVARESSALAASYGAALEEATRLLLTAETSCYWYWTGQTVWDRQVTNAANLAISLVRGAMEAVDRRRADRTGPTIFAPWITPENPGGLRWGQGCLLPAPREGVVHTFVYDLSGMKRIDLIVRSGAEEIIRPMTNHGPYRSETGAVVSADYCTASLPVGLHDVRYFIEAEDRNGNRSRSALERIYLA